MSRNCNCKQLESEPPGRWSSWPSWPSLLRLWKATATAFQSVSQSAAAADGMLLMESYGRRKSATPWNWREMLHSMLLLLLLLLLHWWWWLLCCCCCCCRVAAAAVNDDNDDDCDDAKTSKYDISTTPSYVSIIEMSAAEAAVATAKRTRVHDIDASVQESRRCSSQQKQISQQRQVKQRNQAMHTMCTMFYTIKDYHCTRER